MSYNFENHQKAIMDLADAKMEYSAFIQRRFSSITNRAPADALAAAQIDAIAEGFASRVIMAESTIAIHEARMFTSP